MPTLLLMFVFTDDRKLENMLEIIFFCLSFGTEVTKNEEKN